jgi:hypothetical protein
MRISGLIILLLLAVSCGRNDVPKGILPPEKFEDVLKDVLLAESFAESYLVVDTTKKLKDWYVRELDKVIAIHKVSQKELLASIDYYKTQPDRFKVIMDSVNNRAIREKDRIFKEAMNKKKDSK